jgi:prephenate dehydratase/chorismate mutase/prephenate dehydratase
MNLEDLRTDIDILDAKIVKLINDRMEKAILSKKLKKEILDSGREAEVLARVKRNARSLVDPAFIERIYKDVLLESKRLQAVGYPTIGFLGEHGSNSEQACRAWDPNVIPISCSEFPEILDNVENDIIDYGILPVENTLGGVVGPANSLLVFTNLHIISAVDIPITYSLLAAEGVDYREIRKVYSHPQALLQCRNFIARAKLEPIPYGDTANAAKYISEERPSDAAAISTPECGELYNLNEIKANVQDAANNRTRFFVLAKQPNEKGGNKCSAVFTPENKAGDLFQILEIFAKAGLNLTRIESVPGQVPGEFAIFIDFSGSDKDPKVIKAIAEVSKRCQDFRVLGCYDEKVL